jgi:hypothetical protein
MAGDLVTSDYVFVESWCLIRARLGRGAAMKYWDAMQSNVVKTPLSRIQVWHAS